MAAETDWELLENTLAAAARAASGLPVGKVLWEGQTLPSGLSNAAVLGSGRPALPYLTLFRDAEDCLSFLPEVRAGDNANGHPGVVAGTDTITPALDPATPQASVPVGHLAQWGEAGTTGTATIGTGGAAEVVSFTTGAAGLAFTPWPTKAHAAGAAIARAAVVGTELLVDYDTPAEFQVRLQAFTAEVRGNNAAHALLSKAHAYFLTDAGRDALRPVGLAVIEVGTVQNLTGLVETRMEGRAALDLRVRFVDGAQQASTFISSVEITPTIDGTPGTPFTVTLPEEG